MESTLASSTYHHGMLLQQFLPAIEFFIFQQDGAPVHRALEAINFSPITLPNSELFQKFFQNRLSSKFVVKQWLNVPSYLNHIATLRRDVSLVIIHVSGCRFFPDINISQSSVAACLRCGVIFYYRFGGYSAKYVGEKNLEIGQHLAS